MQTVNRREFNRAIAVSTIFSPFTISGTKASGDILGANDRIRHAVIGINGQGRAHIGESYNSSGFASLPDVEVTTLVDPDSRLFQSRAKQAEDAGGRTPNCLQDFRRVLDDPNIDTISIATPNHWHSLMAIWACEAGKDVYVEKPLSHNIQEGRRLVKAAQKYNRVVQHGTQQRSRQTRANEISAVRSGKYGKLLVSKGYCCKPRWSIGSKPIETPPVELDFDLWLGPAAKQGYHANLVHYNWHWFWDFGGGDLSNQGVHQCDVARWAIKDATHPTRIWSLGGRLGYSDQGQVPNTLLTGYEYGDVLLLMETRGLVGKHKNFDRIVANEYYTTDGMIRDGVFYPSDNGAAEKIEDEGSIKVTPGGQFGSFINAVRSRHPDDNNANVLEGHYSSSLCHLGNISYRLGKSATLDDAWSSIGRISGAEASLEVIIKNLAAVGVAPSEADYRIGRHLEFDAIKERFVDDIEADSMLIRDYREPFALVHD